MIPHLWCSAKSKKVLLYEPNFKCHLSTISKGSLGIYYSQINTCLTEVCLHFFSSSEVRKKLRCPHNCRKREAKLPQWITRRVSTKMMFLCYDNAHLNESWREGQEKIQRKKPQNLEPLWPDNLTLINTKNLKNQVFHIKTDCSFLD